MRHNFISRGGPTLFLAATFALSSASSLAALADDGDDSGSPPPAVARVSVADGDVGVKHGQSDQVAAAINAPVEAGDYLTTGNDGRTEIQLDPSNVVRAAGNTQIRFTTLNGASDTVQLAQGTVELRVLQADNDHPTVQTPSADVVPDEAGAYFVSVDQNGMTSVTVRSGSLDVNTPQGSQTLNPGRTMQITGSADNPQYQYVDEVAASDFDNWADSRDQMLADSNAYQNVNGDMLGASDLDQYGQWQNISGYGEAWQPNNAAPDWSPYSDGNWSYQPYYGWTWVSAEPWGWAPYHYGRWAFVGSSWYWVPGPRYIAPVYSPALVAFFGFGGGGVGLGLGFGFGHIGWVPLAPGEAFHPWWGAGRAVVYNNTRIINNYRNAGHGLVGLPVTGWQHGDFGHITRLSPTVVGGARAIGGRLPFTPTAANYRYSSRSIGATVSKPMYTRFNSIHPIGDARPSYAVRSSYARGMYTSSNTWQRFGGEQRTERYASERSGFTGSGDGWQHFNAAGGSYQRSSYGQPYQRSSYGQPHQRSSYGQPYQRSSYSRSSYQPQQRSYQAPQRSYSRSETQSRGSGNPHGRPHM